MGKRVEEEKGGRLLAGFNPRNSLPEVLPRG